MIRDMSLQWLKSDEKLPAKNGLVVAIKEIWSSSKPDVTIFSSLDAANTGVRNYLADAMLFVQYDMPEEFKLPNPVFKLVGDPERGTSRRVYEYISKDSGLDFRLGLTIHEARGTWSSEPHDFEIEALTSLKPMRFWEQFAYITDPPNQSGIQTRQGYLNGEWMQDVKVIGDRDILDIPLGVHMVTAGPGVRLAYIWVYQAEDITKAEKF